jgi:hypothetical protein
MNSHELDLVRRCGRRVDCRRGAVHPVARATLAPRLSGDDGGGRRLLHRGSIIGALVWHLAAPNSSIPQSTSGLAPRLLTNRESAGLEACRPLVSDPRAFRDCIAQKIGPEYAAKLPPIAGESPAPAPLVNPDAYAPSSGLPVAIPPLHYDPAHAILPDSKLTPGDVFPDGTKDAVCTLQSSVIGKSCHTSRPYRSHAS